MRQINNLIRRIDLTSLQLFVAVCEEGTLTRAASRENIAMSAVSKRLAELEEALGTDLFVRHSKGMMLAPAGESLLHHARSMLTSVEKMGAELDEYRMGIRGHIRMLANVSAIVEFLPDDLPAFFATHSLVKIHLEERLSAGVVKAVEEGYAEVGICVSTTNSRDLFARPYRSDRLALAVPQDHPLADRAPIDFVESLDFDHIGFHADSAIYTRSRAAAAEAGKAVNLRINVPSFDAICRMVQCGLGVGLIPDRAFEVLASGMGIKAIPLRDDWAYRELKIVTRDPAGLSTVTKMLVEHLAQSGGNRAPASTAAASVSAPSPRHGR
ncbi:LysR family transcriptional regulator [Bradyrhizobium sp. 83002]|uniref:LysR family transcriptional regulator n=1 Tax=Bradyrhizobium aeschynomenes TaxID=2734909 RepID=UPI001556962F|nr:LysR family transcriptional regulator [Bradyrhizobium aeschynomenes]NPU09882.1 LysR family transcriptional regulator [Bradyrhizobium aeschynomenes]